MGRMGFLPVVFLLVGLSLVPLRGEDRGNGGSANREAAGAVSRMNEGMKEGETDISPRDAYYIGRAVGANILRRYRPYRSPGLTAYLNRICNALVIN
ncbi:MAG: peptidase M48, partial [Spirochaetaceae bacterium]|nr:peptidase M48 [Spirochaetaceae bacterium]